MESNAVSYQIRNTVLPVGYLYDILRRTLNLFNEGHDISNSPYVQWGRMTLAENRWWYGCQKRPRYAVIAKREQCIQERQQKVINLYLSLRDEGYTGSEISVFFSKDGNIHTYDGFHRLCLMKYLGMDVMLNVVVSTHDKNPLLRGDFPLAETLIAINGGERLYQPVDDERVKGFKLWRHECDERLAFILQHLDGQTVLDVGSETGWFSRELAKRGYEVTAIEPDEQRIAVSRYLAIITNLRVNHLHESWQTHLRREGRYDAALFLSVFHHNILAVGVEQAFSELAAFKGKTKQLFFECPSSASEIKWLRGTDKQKYHFLEADFIRRVEETVDMRVTASWKGVRYIYLLEA
jgi:2-polyprenyl-3-methyl-5-hydroxy-6-metoxy-1,4-benzoquinol methylase